MQVSLIALMYQLISLVRLLIASALLTAIAIVRGDHEDYRCGRSQRHESSSLGRRLLRRKMLS